MVLFIFNPSKTFGALNLLNNPSQEQNGDGYVSQYVNMTDVGNDTPLKDNANVTTTLVLPDNKVFFGGENGAWAIEDIVDGTPGNIINGKITTKDYFSKNSITTAFISSDYSSSHDIVLGFDNGYIGFFNEDTHEVFDIPGWDQMIRGVVDSKVIKIEFTGIKNDYYYYGASGQIVKANKINSEHGQVYKMEIGSGETITSIDDSSDGRIIVGTNNASIYKCDVESNKTDLILKLDSESSQSINTLTNVSSKIIFAGLSNGHWYTASLKDKKVVTSGDWKTSDSMNSSLLLPDDKGSEVLVGGGNGYWGIIDTNKAIPDGQERLINHGNLYGGNDINSLRNLDEDNNSIFMFAGNNGKWFTEKPIGFITGFDQTKKPETTLITKDEIDYKITTKNDYPSWPIDIRKYRIKSTVRDTSTGSDFDNVSPASYDAPGEIEVKLKDLIPSNTYEELRIQLVEEDGETAIGQEWNTHLSFDTLLGRVTNITSASIDEDSINSNGFDFTIDTFDCESADRDKVEPYTISVSAKVDGNPEEVIWTSRIQRRANDGTKFTINTLSPGVEYDDVSVIASYEDSGEVGTKLKISDKVVTKNIPQSVSAHFDAAATSSSSFSVVVNITAEDSDRQIPDGYYVNITNDSNINFTSEKVYDTNEQTFKVDGLNPGETYDNIRVYLSWDKDGNDPIPNCVSKIGKTTIDNNAKEIKSASYGEISYDSITIKDIEIGAESETQPISNSYIINVYDQNDPEKNLLYYSNPSTESGNIGDIEITGLESGVSYKFELQLVEAKDIETKIGNPYKFPDEVTTTPSHATGISNSEVLDNFTTGETFVVRLGIKSQGASQSVTKYKMVVSAKIDDSETEEVIWTSGDTTEAGDGVKFTVGDGGEGSKVKPSTKYSDLLYDLQVDGSPIDTKQTNNSVTTLGAVTGIIGESMISGVTDGTFDMTINVKDTFDDGSSHHVEDYWIMVYANNENIPIWSSLDEDPEHKNGFNKSGVNNFTVKGLTQRTVYSNITVQLVDHNGDPIQSKNTELSIKTKMSPKTKAMIEIGSLVAFVAFILIIITIVILVKRSKNAKKDRFAQNIKFRR